MFTPAMIASSVSAFWRVIMSYALATPRMPLAEEMTTGGAADPPGVPLWPSASRSRVRPAPAAALNPTNWRREIDTPSFSQKELTANANYLAGSCYKRGSSLLKSRYRPSPSPPRNPIASDNYRPTMNHHRDFRRG